MTQRRFHDDDCGELLDANGMCPRCGFHPDMQSVGLRDVPDAGVAAKTIHIVWGGAALFVAHYWRPNGPWLSALAGATSASLLGAAILLAGLSAIELPPRDPPQ